METKVPLLYSGWSGNILIIVLLSSNIKIKDKFQWNEYFLVL